jgi:adenylylsulfate kinase
MNDTTIVNLSREISFVNRIDREDLAGHKSFVVWFTGLSGAGKSTLAKHLEKRLHDLKCRTMVLDGDNMRHGLCRDLDFSDQDRSENIRRVAEVSSLFLDAGVVVIAAFISPFASDRENVKRIVGSENYFEVYCSCPLAECEKRDIKGIYKLARNGKINNFTGIGSPYQPPLDPHVEINSLELDIEESIEKILSQLRKAKFL